MNKPTVESISLVYCDEKGQYAAVMAVDTISNTQYIVLDVGKYKDTVLKYAQDIADRLGLELVDETKEDITISGERLLKKLIRNIETQNEVVKETVTEFKQLDGSVSVVTNQVLGNGEIVEKTRTI